MSLYPVASPLVIVHNYLETFREFLARDGDDHALMERRFNGDQALFWLGDNKLIFSSAPIENIDLLADRWGYSNVASMSPVTPSSQLSLDIKANSEMLGAIRSHAGDQKEITLISYSASAELFSLVEHIESKLGVQVYLPETPDRDRLWLKQYIDSKVGFRSLVQKWVGDSCLPDGYIVNSPGMIADIARYFASEGKGVAIKANIGGSGVGNIFLSADEILSDQFGTNLASGDEISEDMVYVVEETIPSREKVSPSLEFYVPPMGQGDPVLTYLCNQHFESSGRFAGVIIAEEFYRAPWYADFKQVGLRIAAELQGMGYVGHFDLDAIVGDNGKLYLVEINSRRTGGTFAHEFMSKQFGPDYSKGMSVLSQIKMPTRMRSLAEAEENIGDLLLREKGGREGVIVMLSSTLPKGTFGYLIVGKSVEDLVGMQSLLQERIQ